MMFQIQILVNLQLQEERKPYFKMDMLKYIILYGNSIFLCHKSTQFTFSSIPLQFTRGTIFSSYLKHKKATMIVTFL